MVCLASLLLSAASVVPSIHQPDTAPLIDPERTVSGISRTSFSLQYATSTPCETKVEVRQGDSLSVLGPNMAPDYRVVSAAGSAEWHTVTVSGLKPGKRYYYRLYDPGATPTSSEVRWGASAPWSKEFAVSTEAAIGRKTIIHLPVKVLLMPNVVNAESAVQPDGSIAPEPPKITAEQLSLIENEFRVASRVFWCNSGMRLWVDFKFFVDDRWQRWGAPAPSASPFFQNLPVCRSYAGKDYVEPGGGGLTILDTHDVKKDGVTPVADGYACQVEMAWPRRWDAVSHKWTFYPSGGGTQGAEDLPRGIPARSQFLAGGDTAWLAANEFHHQLESLGGISLGNSEGDRIVSDKPAPRRRIRRGDGTYDEQDWTTTGPHGEFWDILRYWDRQVSDCQWLRLGFGTTETVVDKDGDGFPDKDSRLPLDASRMKAYAAASADYGSACAWDWVMLPVQPSWVKDRSGMDHGGVDPVHGWLGWSHEMTKAEQFAAGYSPQPGRYYFNELSGFSWEPILPFDATFNPANTAGRLGGTGHIGRPRFSLTYTHSYDEAGYYGLIVAKGPVDHIDVDLDGEGKGMFTPPGALGFSIVSLKPSAGQAGPVVLPVSVRPTFGGVQNRTPWLTWNASRRADATLVFEFKIANGGDSPWFWHGAGQKIGVSINAYDLDGRGYSVGEPYRLNYSTMAERRGAEPRPPAPPALTGETVTLKPGDKAFTLSPGWSLAEDGTYRHEGDAGAIVIGGQKAVDFDLIVNLKAAGDYGVGAYAPQTPRPDPDRDYGAFFNGGRATLHVNGIGSDSQPVPPGGNHQVELRRRNGGVWLLIDNKLIASEVDKNPRVLLNRFAVWAAGGSSVLLQGVSYRLPPAS